MNPLGDDGLYYPDLELPEETNYQIGRYGRMLRKHLQKQCRREYIQLLMDGMLNEHLYEVEQECYEWMEILMEQMKAQAGITEELKRIDPIKWIGEIQTFGFDQKSQL